jgi:glycerate kinase
MIPNATAPTIVLAPDSFKGSLTAQQACDALSEGLLRVYPHATLRACPMADGGEGTLDALLSGSGTRQRLTVRGASGAPRDIAAGLFDDHTAVIETAEIVGITDAVGMAIPVEGRSTAGLGEALRALLDQGARRFLIGLGGSSTNDAGVGLLAALGVRFYAADGRLLDAVPAGLEDLARVDLAELDPRLAQIQLIAMSDVDNPLCGPHGATAVFGPQKGVKPAQHEALDQLLERCANLLEAAFDRDVQHAPGAGAAGGLGFALQLLGAEFRRGADVVAEHLGLSDALRDADWMITGEGRSDLQSLRGKAPMIACRYAHEAGVPITLLSGAIGPEALPALSLYFSGCFSLAAGPMTLGDAVANAHALLANAAQQLGLLRLAAQTATRPPPQY